MSEQKILVIDDSKTIRRLCDSELSAAGYVVLLAPTAEEGVDAAATQAPDLIILDHQLPGTTGYEVCVQLLANPETAKIPVVGS
jgi:CheY-like chemotaxis protein